LSIARLRVVAYVGANLRVRPTDTRQPQVAVCLYDNDLTL
jgi:hypothetical protein